MSCNVRERQVGEGHTVRDRWGCNLDIEGGNSMAREIGAESPPGQQSLEVATIDREKATETYADDSSSASFLALEPRCVLCSETESRNASVFKKPNTMEYSRMEKSRPKRILIRMLDEWDETNKVTGSQKRSNFEGPRAATQRRTDSRRAGRVEAGLDHPFPGKG